MATSKNPALKHSDPGIVEPLITMADIDAMEAVVGGVASPQQAKHAMDWVMREGARVQDLAFQLGGEDGRRATDFAAGRQYVGHQIRRLLQPYTRKSIESGKPGPTLDERRAEQIASHTEVKPDA